LSSFNLDGDFSRQMKRERSDIIEVASQGDFNYLGGVEKDPIVFSDHEIDCGIVGSQRVDLGEPAREIAAAKRVVEVDDDLELSVD
jgi:hypothetical protein